MRGYYACFGRLSGSHWTTQCSKSPVRNPPSSRTQYNLPVSNIRRSHPRLVSAYRRLLLALPSKVSLSLQYWRAHGSLPNLRSPRKLSEKIQYRKLFDRDPRLPLFADKIRVKDYVTERLGKDWVIPTLWCGRQFPPRPARNWAPPYVIKTNHGSGRNIFVKTDPDWEKIERWCERWLRQTWQAHELQWLYSKIDPQLLVEPHIGSVDARPVDYKFFVFGGRMEYVHVHTDREVGHKGVFFDRNWQRQPFGLGVPIETREIARPAHLPEMISAAETLADDIPFVRVDLYDLDRPLFGEMTFYPASGYDQFSPRTWDARFGELWPWP